MMSQPCDCSQFTTVYGLEPASMRCLCHNEMTGRRICRRAVNLLYHRPRCTTTILFPRTIAGTIRVKDTVILRIDKWLVKKWALAAKLKTIINYLLRVASSKW